MKTIALALMASAILGFGTLALGSGPCPIDAGGSCCCDVCPPGCCE
jgi:hypothetical protein